MLHLCHSAIDFCRANHDAFDATTSARDDVGQPRGQPETFDYLVVVAYLKYMTSTNPKSLLSTAPAATYARLGFSTCRDQQEASSLLAPQPNGLIPYLLSPWCQINYQNGQHLSTSSLSPLNPVTSRTCFWRRRSHLFQSSQSDVFPPNIQRSPILRPNSIHRSKIPCEAINAFMINPKVHPEKKVGLMNPSGGVLYRCIDAGAAYSMPS